MNEQQGMNGAGQGPAGGGNPQAMGQGGMGQSPGAPGGMGQGGLNPGGMGQPGMTAEQAMHAHQQAYPYPQQPYPFGPYPYGPYPQAMAAMPGYSPGMAAGVGQGMGSHGGSGQGMAQAMQEMANGGGLSSLTKLLDFDDKDFWKGALVGAAAVLLLTNESVQRAIFRGAVKGRDAVEEGVDKVREGVDKVKQKVRDSKEKDDE